MRFIQRHVFEWAANQPLVAEVWLFGSQAKGKARNDSDIDLAFLLSPKTVALQRAYWIEEADEWKTQLENALSYSPVSVNFMDLDSPNSPVVTAVRGYGIMLFPNVEL